MGTMSFLLPAGLTTEAAQGLERTCVAGGPDNMPWPTEVKIESENLKLNRDVDESGCVVAPWDIENAGRLMGTTGTLVERDDPYHFQLEMARGKVNQLRCQLSDWQTGGLQVPEALTNQIREASLCFGKSVTQAPSPESEKHAQAALVASYQASDRLVKLYIEQMYQGRHQRQPRLDTTLGCRVGASSVQHIQSEALLQACNGICLPFAWREIEPEENDYCWKPHDDLLDWAERQGVAAVGGPLIDFTASRLPSWLWFFERDLTSIASFMCDYVESVIKRYRGRIRVWQLTNASNCASVLSLGEDELLWLTVRLAEAARQADPNLQLVVGIAQPWGEYMATEDRTHSPFIFADTLIRSGLNLSALDIELVMGVSPRGSYCRDMLETSRLLDLYALLGVPLRVTVAYPSAATADENADPEFKVTAGSWRDGFSSATQADWAEQFASLALCKPSIRAVHWAQLSDAVPHPFPHCGLLDSQDQPKPVLARLRTLRENHLR